MTVHTSLVSLCLLAWGTPEQKRAYLPRLARGELIGCYCLTEPNAGSDAGAIETTAARDGDEYIVNGEKIWITNGGIADLAVIFANADPALKHKGICAFLVPTDLPGFRREKMKGQELGHRASDHARICFEDMRVPQSALLGPAGAGFKVAMSALDNGRISLAAGAVGLARGCVEAATAYATERTQFGKPIAGFQLVQELIADAAVETEAARLMAWRAAALSDAGEPYTLAASQAKYYASEVAVRAANAALQVHGGYGYVDEFPVARYLRDARVLTLYEGTSQVQKLLIGRALTGEGAFV